MFETCLKNIIFLKGIKNNNIILLYLIVCTFFIYKKYQYCQFSVKYWPRWEKPDKTQATRFGLGWSTLATTLPKASTLVTGRIWTGSLPKTCFSIGTQPSPTTGTGMRIARGCGATTNCTISGAITWTWSCVRYRLFVECEMLYWKVTILNFS